MEWVYTVKDTPYTYETGDWDGKRSNLVLAEDINGKHYLAHVYEGRMDGVHFIDWCDNHDYSINTEIYRWLRIPN